jgi:hypothetical protein
MALLFPLQSVAELMLVSLLATVLKLVQFKLTAAFCFEINFAVKFG